MGRSPPILFPFMINLLIVTQQLTSVDMGNERKIKVGMLVTKSTPEVSVIVGFQTSASAVMIAIDRIKIENILPNTNITFLWYFDECEDYLSAGYSTRMILADGVDVILGPTCPDSALTVSTIAKFYNFPIFLWGSIMPTTISDVKKYPTVTTTTAITYPVAAALLATLKQFQWSEFALVYSTSRSNKIPRCSFIAQDIEYLVNTESSVTLSLSRTIDSIDDLSNGTIFMSVKSRARIVAACLETDDERRAFLKATIYAGQTPFWVSQTAIQDGLDDIIRAACNNVLIIDMGLSNATISTFGGEVLSRMKEYPFYCTTECKDNVEAAMRSPNLADAMYIYAIALNRTLSKDPVNGHRDGRAIAAATSGSYNAYSGYVKVGKDGSQQSFFMLLGMDINGDPQTFAYIAFNGSGTIWKSTYSDEASSIWAVRNGVRPVSKPKCGFSGNECQPSFMETYFVYTLIGLIVIVLLIIFVLVAIAFLIRHKRKEQQRLDRLWQVNFDSLVKPSDKGTRVKSMRSLQSVSTEITLENLVETKTLAFYYLFGEKVVARKYVSRPPIEKNHAAELRSGTRVKSMRSLQSVSTEITLENLVETKTLAFYYLFGEKVVARKYVSRPPIEKNHAAELRSDIIENGTSLMDAFFMLSIMKDVCAGLHAIHTSSIGYHGYLTSSACLVDERWLVKISNFGLKFLNRMEPKPQYTLLWVAPEHLRADDNIGSKKGDVYSFAIICSEIITKKSAFDANKNDGTVEEILHNIKRTSSIPLRPTITAADSNGTHPALVHLIHDCWSEDPDFRPQIDTVKNVLKSMHRGGNLMDHVFNLLEQYASSLENEVEERTKELVEEKKKSDVLLYRMLPKLVADRLKLGQSVEPESFESVTVFFSDVVKFTVLASKCTPLQVVSLLNDLYTTFDSIIDEHHVYKVETIGDGYLCVSGLPHRNGNEHARDVAEMSFAFLKNVAVFRISHLPNERINIRIGLHTGPVVVGVVGLTMPRYCLFGDTVNTASRMESSGKPGHIHISAETNRYLTKIIGGYRTESRGEVIIKGKGVMETFWLLPEGEMSDNAAEDQF
ncbi:Guanylate cyclase receptor-type gcy-1 [Toxocara canis]|uniref:Guanylate cyclase n=1 Tax=Toxocara canis TaxID=6265 RepID=A0A0B2VIS1_TOXCA|nr:Guanylate cyclase receptor-type gcy-1 [Toxocara canis]